MLEAEDLTAMFVKALLADFRKFNMPWLLAPPPTSVCTWRPFKVVTETTVKLQMMLHWVSHYPPHTKWRLF